jgi:hypothetical protein
MRALLIAGFALQWIAGLAMFVGAPRMAGLFLLAGAAGLLYVQLFSS